jgi:hypothetical protein
LEGRPERTGAYETRSAIGGHGEHDGVGVVLRGSLGGLVNVRRVPDVHEVGGVVGWVVGDPEDGQRAFAGDIEDLVIAAWAHEDRVV